MKHKILVIIGVAELALAGCVFGGECRVGAATNSVPPSVVAPKAQAPVGGPYTVIGYLEGRGRVITIKSSPHGTVYTVATTDGKVLHENLSAEQLRAKAPELQDLVNRGVAKGNDASLQVHRWTDATGPR